MPQSVTVRQVLKMKGEDVSDTMTLIGRLVFKPGGTNSWMFEINDTTGSLSASKVCVTTHVVESVEERIKEESTERLEPAVDIGVPTWEDGAYHRVFGSMNFSVDMFEIEHIQPVVDKNEITMHLLECIYQHCLTNKP